MKSAEEIVIKVKERPECESWRNKKFERTKTRRNFNGFYSFLFMAISMSPGHRSRDCH